MKSKNIFKVKKRGFWEDPFGLQTGTELSANIVMFPLLLFGFLPKKYFQLISSLYVTGILFVLCYIMFKLVMWQTQTATSVINNLNMIGVI